MKFSAVNFRTYNEKVVMTDRDSKLRLLLESISISLFIAIGAYLLNLLLFTSSELISTTQALFIEGAASFLLGLLLLLGKGGINYSSLQAAILSAKAEAVSGGESVGPAEQMRRDTWKSKGFLRAGLIAITAGIFMIIGYFLVL